LVCSLAAATTAGLGVVVSLASAHWNTSGLVRLWDALKLAKLARQGAPAFPLRGLAGRYDGAYFYAIARDPLAIGQAHTLVPQAPTTGVTLPLDGSPGSPAAVGVPQRCPTRSWRSVCCRSPLRVPQRAPSHRQWAGRPGAGSSSR